MHISTVQSTKNVHTDSFPQQSSAQQTESASNNNANAYSLDISDEARGLSRSSKTDTVDDLQIPEGVAPVEAYAIPKWQAALLPEEMLLRPVIGESYIGSSSEKYDSLSSETKAELQEYAMKLQEYSNEEMNKLGVKNSVDYYYKCMQDTELSEKVHQAVINRLAESPRMMALMQSLGVSLN